jgi:hypothetical protein
MANKKTQKDFFNEIIEVLNEVGRDDLVEFCEDRIEKLSRKSSNKKPTKTQIENEGIKDTVLEVLADLDNAVTTSALATDPRISVSTQKLSPILKALVAEGRVIRSEEKGRAVFSLPLRRTIVD